ncbi:LolA family protein [Ferdinandcohnia sp. Marseille-Q9671]
MSSEEIISNVLASKEKNISYYGEGVMKLLTNDQVTEHATFEEFALEDGKRKIILTDHMKNNQKSYTLNDGKQIISYEQDSEEALRMDLSAEEMPALGSPKEQLMVMLDSIRDTHDYEIVGEETLHDLQVYHVKATSKTDSSFLGDVEIWVDQKTWVMVKIISIVGEAKSEVEYKVLDFSPDFSENTFTLEIPENVAITQIDSKSNSTNGTIHDAEHAIGQSILVFREDDLTLESVEITDLKGETNRTEVTVYYMDQNIPSLIVSVFPTPEGEGMSLKPGKWQVRGQDAEYDDFINALSWDEDGLRYTIIPQNPDISIEEVITLTKNMQFSSDL